MENKINEVSKEGKIVSKINETIQLNAPVFWEEDGVSEQILTVDCSLAANSVANIQTYVIDQKAFLKHSQDIVAEVQKFREKATEKGKTINCFVF